MFQFSQSEMNISLQSPQIDQRSTDMLANITNNANKLKDAHVSSQFIVQDLEKLYERLMNSNLE
jgi:hypothetical protein